MVLRATLVASNRGPLAFTLGPDGKPVARHAPGGGLVTGLARVSDLPGSVWVCAALSDADRAAAGPAGGVFTTAGGGRVRMLTMDPDVFEAAYNRVANATLWYLHHEMFATPTEPVFDQAFDRDWRDFVTYNEAFAHALAGEAPSGGRVLVQDYHLSLVPRMVRELRPDLRVGFFAHTPWAGPETFALLPDRYAAPLVAGVLGADAVGFLTHRWAQSFLASVAARGLAVSDRATVAHEGHTTAVAVHPLGVDPAELATLAAGPQVAARAVELREATAGRRLVVRVDRTEPSKNIVRGLLAFRELLVRWPHWRGRVVHVVHTYPSRHALAAYREYTAAVHTTADAINDELGDPGWQPVLLTVADDLSRSLAAYSLADVVLVNPLRDGMNLVAKEAMVVAGGAAALVLSTEAGAAEELGDLAFLVPPCDVSATAEALLAALETDPATRMHRRAELAARATALPPQAWVSAQLADLDDPRPGAAVRGGGES